MIHDLKGLIHTIAASVAILTGAVIFLRPKGGRAHRWLGYVYSLCMLTVIVTSFAIYRLTGRFNFLHGAAIASSISLGLGFGHAFLRKPKDLWYVWHYYWMSWSFIGLAAAFVAEISTRVAMPYIIVKLGHSYLFGFWSVVGLVTLFVVMFGRWLVNRHAPKPPFKTIQPGVSRDRGERARPGNAGEVATRERLQTSFSRPPL